VQAGARRALNEIAQAEDRAHAERAIEALVSDYGAKWPKAVAKVVDDRDALLAFFDYPAEHWLHLRTTNPIWVFSLARWIALPERDLAGHRWLGPDSESDWSSTRMPSNSRCWARPTGTRRLAAWLERSLGPQPRSAGPRPPRVATGSSYAGDRRLACRRQTG
jgi:hypothetical protein